jgi:predicted Zn-ribbon and HTH transcriptional regulator
MSRPAVEVADILRAHEAHFLNKNRSWLSFQQLTVLRAIARCRTAALGGHLDSCSQCGHQAISYNSCRNRHCPKCQTQARQRWLTAREQEVLGVPYFHVVFTLPHELNTLCQRNQKVLYDLLFRSSAAAMLEVAADPKHLGAEIGFLSILHTWGQNLLLHPHVHCVVPAGGLAPDHQRWIHPKYAFFLPVKVLGQVLRRKFLQGLRRAFRLKKLHFHSAAAALAAPKQFWALVQKLRRQDWVVYAKAAFGGPGAVLRYLGRYTHRVAISNHRLVAHEGDQVTFRWKDYARGNKQRLMTLSAEEFLRRFVQHILPRGFVRIRQFGFLANACRTKLIAVSRQLLAFIPDVRASSTDLPTTVVSKCPHCGAPMQILEKLSTLQLKGRCRFIDTS